MRVFTFRTLVGLAAFVASGLSHAAALPLDDSGTYAEGATPMRWRAEQAGQRDSLAVDGRMRVHVLLQTQRWQGQRARIYMHLAPQALTSLQVQWQGRGILLPGTLRGGQRVLVHEGLMAAAPLSETIDLTVSADGRELAAPHRLEFGFEIEVP